LLRGKLAGNFSFVNTGEFDTGESFAEMQKKLNVKWRAI
jgi:hypothetical protein